MTIKRNAERTVPASHTVEMIFTMPENFGGGGIDNILRIALKPSEVAAGAPLLGIPLKIADDYFVVALNEVRMDVRTNLDLLQSDQWIDVPLVYKSGRRAMITLEKGAFGNFAFNGAVSDWRWRAGMAETELPARRNRSKCPGQVGAAPHPPAGTFSPSRTGRSLISLMISLIANVARLAK